LSVAATGFVFFVGSIFLRESESKVDEANSLIIGQGNQTVTLPVVASPLRYS
jgi:hypothetical protein